MKKFINNNYKIIAFLLLTIFYFEYSVSITWDSAHYLGYVKIIERIMPFSSWDVVRGPVFPFIIYFSNVLFSKTNHGLIMGTYLFYLIMLLFTCKIMDYYFKKIKINKKMKNIIKYGFLFLTIINPSIYGYYHCLLTEYVAITLSVVSCYYAIVWLNTNHDKERRQYFLLTILFMFLTVFSWFLKQPYVSCGIFALIVAYLISLFQDRKKFFVRTITIIACILSLFVSIKVWNAILNSHGNDTSTNRNPTNALGNQFVRAIDFLDMNIENEIFSKKYIKNTKLSKKEKEDIYKLLNNNEKYVLVYKFDNNNKLVDVDYIKSSNGHSISLVSSFAYLFKTFIHNPPRLINSYITNYFSIIDIYSTSTTDGVGYSSNKKFDLSFSNEIRVIGNKPYAVGDTNFFPLSDELYNNASYYEQRNRVNNKLNNTMLFLSKIFIFLFKIIFFILPILLITSIVMRFLKRFKKDRDLINVIIILLGFSFLHILLHTVTGAIIDRYALPAFITCFLGIVFFCVLLFRLEKN